MVLSPAATQLRAMERPSRLDGFAVQGWGRTQERAHVRADPSYDHMCGRCGLDYHFEICGSDSDRGHIWARVVSSHDEDEMKPRLLSEMRLLFEQ